METSERRIRGEMEKLGFSVRISWVEVEKTPFDPVGELIALARKPLAWALLGAAIAVLFMVGFKTFSGPFSGERLFILVPFFFFRERRADSGETEGHCWEVMD